MIIQNQSTLACWFRVFENNPKVKEPPILGISKDQWFSWKNQVKDRQFLWAVIWFVNFVENGESTYQYQFSNSFENRAYISLSLSEELVFGFLWRVAVNPKNRPDNLHGSVGLFLVPTTILKPRFTFLDEWIRQMYLPSSMDAALGLRRGQIALSVLKDHV
jgi:hypothetical protein